MRPRDRVLLLVDAGVNLVLGAALLLFPTGLVRFLGVPPATSRFYPSLLGAVLFGIGVALLVERHRKAGRLAGLGLAGAVAINISGGVALAAWLIFGGLDLPPRGRMFLWALGVVLVSISALEAAGRRRRREGEPPEVISRRGWRYHHVGIPTTTPRLGERHLEDLRIFVSGFETSPYRIEWMRFEPGCEVSELVRTVPHVAFEVDDLDRAIKGLKLLGGVSSPMEGVRVAMIEDNGAPVELIEFAQSKPAPKKKNNHEEG
jgi:hypothetical protein